MCKKLVERINEAREEVRTDLVMTMEEYEAIKGMDKSPAALANNTFILGYIRGLVAAHSLEVSDLLSDIEMAQEKAQLTCYDLTQDFFSLKEESHICFYHDASRIRNDIVFDYIIQIRDAVKKIRAIGL